MEKLKFEVIIDEKDFATAKRKDAGAYQQRIEVIAKGKTFKERAAHPKGGGFVKCDGKTCGVYMEELRNTDEELVQKFTENVSRLLPLDKARMVAQTMLELETVQNAAELMETVAL